MDESTRKDFPAWGMMVGRQEGRFLELLVFATQATSVLEIGTFTGYSSIAMAAGLIKGGSIISLEVDAHHAATARGNIAAAGLESHISVIEGPALRSLPSSRGPSTWSSLTPTRSATTPTSKPSCPSSPPTG